MEVLITGAGSVMGQSIYKALCRGSFSESINVHFANSDKLGAGLYFENDNCPIVAAPIFPLASDIEYSDFIKKYIADNHIDIVFSGTQHELAKICEYRDIYGNAATISRGFAEICLDKVLTAKVLEKYNVPVPKTWSCENYLQTKPSDRAVILKPSHSSASRNVFKIEVEQDLTQILKENNFNVSDFIVQEALEGKEYTCGCYLDKFSKEISTVIFERTLTKDGATGFGKIVYDLSIENYLEMVCRALNKEGFDFGHINIQLIKTDAGPLLFEINGRLSSTEAPKAYFGFNSVEAYVYNICLNKSYSKFDVKERGQFLRYYEEVYF